MPRVAISAIAAVGVIIALGNVGGAEASDVRPGPAPVVTATVTSTTVVVSDEGPAEPPPCTYPVYEATEATAEGFNRLYEVMYGVVGALTGTQIEITITHYVDGGVLHRWNGADEVYERGSVGECTDTRHPDHRRVRWDPVGDPDPIILLARTTRTVTEELTFPDLAVSPVTAAPVNLGLWLAVEEAGPVVAEARLGRVWARTTAAVEETSFDLGNGDTVTCAGHGTPIPRSQIDTVEPGPCGYVYTGVDDVGELTLSATSTWVVSWELSNGRSGRDRDIDVTTSIPYRVYEIQTVGRSD